MGTTVSPSGRNKADNVLTVSGKNSRVPATVKRQRMNQSCQDGGPMIMPFLRRSDVVIWLKLTRLSSMSAVPRTNMAATQDRFDFSREMTPEMYLQPPLRPTAVCFDDLHSIVVDGD